MILAPPMQYCRLRSSAQVRRRAIRINGAVAEVAGEQPTEGELGRVVWRSRRGLLELDLRLVPFARDRYPSLSATDRAMYRKLLEEDDHDILAWLSGRDAPPAPLAGIVSSIAAHTSERP